MKPNHLLKKAAGIFLLICSGLVPLSGQWTQFRGSDQNMVITKSDLPTTWSETQNVKWIYNTDGTGWSSPVVWGNKVFITSAVTIKKVKVPQTPPPTPQTQGAAPAVQPPAPAVSQEEEDTSYRQDVYRWEVTCVDLESGKEIWKQVALEGNPRVKTHDGNGYAAETPVTDGKRVYAYFGMTGLFCYDMDGKLLWKKDLGAFRTMKGWGTGSSPVVLNDIVYVQVDNEVNSFLVALDAQTGNEKWKVNREEKTNYSTPVIWKNSIRSELVILGKTVRSCDLNTGSILWEMKIKGENSIPSPVFEKDMLYLGNAGGRETKGSLYAVKAGAKGDISLAGEAKSNEYIAWSVAEAPIGNPSPVLHNGYLYILSSRGGELSCFDAANGNKVYTNKIESVTACWSTPWIYNNIFYFYDERGYTKQVKTGPQFELIPTQNKLDDKFWASIAVANNSYILKGAKKVYCIKK
jgi:outer membrane protein assembly factor BamB